jgi:hypothetical protein
MKVQLMHFTKMLHVGQIRAETIALTRIYKRVSYILLEHHFWGEWKPAGQPGMSGL